MASGILAGPAGLGDVVFVPEYWEPRHLVAPWLSIEGILFSFGNGCLILAIVQQFAPVPRQDPPQVEWKSLLRITVVMLFGFMAFLVFWSGAIGRLMIMHAAMAGFAAMAIYLSWLHVFSFRVAMTGGCGFFIVYSIEIIGWHWFDPQIADFWTNSGAYWTRVSLLWDIPAEEFVWSFAYGAVWANLILYGFAFRTAVPRLSN